MLWSADHRSNSGKERDLSVRTVVMRHVLRSTAASRQGIENRGLLGCTTLGVLPASVKWTYSKANGAGKFEGCVFASDPHGDSAGPLEVVTWWSADHKSNVLKNISFQLLLCRKRATIWSRRGECARAAVRVGPRFRAASGSGSTNGMPATSVINRSSGRRGRDLRSNAASAIRSATIHSQRGEDARASTRSMSPQV